VTASVPLPRVAAPAPSPALVVVRVFVGLAAVVALVALAAQALPAVGRFARDIYPTGPRPGADVDVVGLLVHNAFLSLAGPAALLLTRWHTHPRWRNAGDVALLVAVGYNAAALGLGIGAHPSVLRYLPHLPMELAALATGVGAWWHLSRGGAPRAVVPYVAFVVAVLLVGAVVEVAAAPR
jgi:hypothetical protein